MMRRDQTLLPEMTTYRVAVSVSFDTDSEWDSPILWDLELRTEAPALAEASDQN